MEQDRRENESGLAELARVAHAFEVLADDDGRAAPRGADGDAAVVDLRPHEADGSDSEAAPSAPDQRLVADLAALRAQVDQLAQRVVDLRSGSDAERSWERSLNHLTAVVVGQRNDHAALRSAVADLTELVTDSHDTVKATKADQSSHQTGNLARHAALLDEVAAATARVEKLAATVKRQQGQITRLRAQVKALKAASAD